MTGTTNKNYTGSVIQIQNNIIKLDDCTFPLSSITQIWIGKVPDKYPSTATILLLLFISLSGSDIPARIFLLSVLGIVLLWYAVHYFQHKDIRGINIQLCNGATYFFVAEDEFSTKVLDQIREVLENTKHDTKYSFNFKGDGTISKQTKERQVKKKQKPKNNSIKISSIESPQNPLVAELSQLHLYYKEQEETDAEILELIENTIQLTAANDREKMKLSFEKFIALGLMKGCNELNLNLLINEIISSIY